MVKPEKLECPVLRNYTKAGGLGTDPWPKHAFNRMLMSVGHAAGYTVDINIHAIRREVSNPESTVSPPIAFEGGANKRTERATEAQRQQHMTQNRPEIHRTNYMANTSSVQGSEAFYRKIGDGRSTRFWTTFEQFWEHDLPCKLTPRLERQLGPTPSSQASSAALRKYRIDWLTERRQWFLETEGKEQLQDLPQCLET